MTWVVMILAILLAAVAQTLLPGYAWLGQAKFPLLICVALYYALNHEFQVAAVAGFAAGLAHDLLSETPMGYSTACFWLAGLIFSRFRRVVLTESVITRATFGALAGAISAAALWLLLAGNGYIRCPVGRAVLKIAGSGLLGTIAGPLTLTILGRLDRLVGNIKAKEEYYGIG
ncbi:MAG: rod shape-determining protein MreD [Verrucomicrobiota bacterium]|nr:rod shape-determining protein MreD [Verrucomicrobiota bacterium]